LFYLSEIWSCIVLYCIVIRQTHIKVHRWCNTMAGQPGK